MPMEGHFLTPCKLQQSRSVSLLMYHGRGASPATPQLCIQHPTLVSLDSCAFACMRTPPQQAVALQVRLVSRKVLCNTFRLFWRAHLLGEALQRNHDGAHG